MSFKVRLVAGKTGLHTTTRTYYIYIKKKDKQKYTSKYIRWFYQCVTYALMLINICLITIFFDFDVKLIHEIKVHQSANSNTRSHLIRSLST